MVRILCTVGLTVLFLVLCYQLVELAIRWYRQTKNLHSIVDSDKCLNDAFIAHAKAIDGAVEDVERMQKLIRRYGKKHTKQKQFSRTTNA